jgi:hypothetical protein
VNLPPLHTGNFCCFALQTRVSENLQGVTQLGQHIYATTEKPFYIDEWWRQQLGELEIADLERCSLFLTAQTPDPHIDVPQLNSTLHSYYYALLVQGVGYSRHGILLGGTNSDGGLRVGSIGWLMEYHEPWKVLPRDINRDHLSASINLVQGIEKLYGSGADYLRLRKGFNALLSGARSDEAHNRLHQFVRALDAVVKAKQGKATQQFKERCQLFAGTTAADVSLLTDLYELRSAAEHLNALDAKLQSYQPHERNNIKALRTFQSELLASHVYRNILLSNTLLANFADDDKIDAMWQQGSAQLQRLWGTTIDLHKTPIGVFFDYLP